MSDSLKTEERELPQLDARCQGNDRELGLALGTELQGKINFAALSITELETFRLHRPWWMPSIFYRFLAQRKARWSLEPRFSDCYPHLAQRILGMAQGARTSVDFLYLFHAMESAPNDVDNPALAGCTAIAARGKKTVDGHAVIGHNFDLVEMASRMLSLRECSRQGKYRYLGFSLAPMAGVVDGVNEAGLAISYDYAPATDVELTSPPVSFAVEETLSDCSSVKEAIRRLSKLPRGGGALLMLADAQGDIASMELSANHHRVRRPKRRSDYIHHSNAYHTRTMRKRELPRTAIYSDTAPEGLRNQPVFQSAQQRDDRMADLAKRSEPLSPDSLARLMSDHDEHGTGSADTICMHGSYWSTLASIQLLPQQRRMRISYGRACQAQYVDLQL